MGANSPDENRRRGAEEDPRVRGIEDDERFRRLDEPRDEKLSALDRTGWDIPHTSQTLSLDRMDRKVAVGAIEEIDLSYRKDNGCTA